MSYTTTASTKRSVVGRSLEGLSTIHYYCRNTASQGNNPTLPTFPELMASLNNGFKTQSLEGFDEGWTIEHRHLSQGQIIAERVTWSGRCFAGEIYQRSMFHPKPVIHAGIKLIDRKNKPQCRFYLYSAIRSAKTIWTNWCGSISI